MDYYLFLYHNESFHSLIYMTSTTLDVLILTKPHGTESVQLVRCQVQEGAESGYADDVILPYLERCPIT